MTMKLIVGFIAVLATGCASVPMASRDSSSKAKQFAPPSQGNAGLYIYREGGVGASLKKDIWVDGRCIGESAPKVFFYEEVRGGQEHTISTESEFSPNDLKLTPTAGSHYFIKQYIKMGLLVGGANLKLMGEAEGMNDVRALEMATKGRCS
jgi:hypothetical protein